MTKRTPPIKTLFRPLGMGVCLGSALLGTTQGAYAQVETGNTVRMERLEKENQELKTRLESLEGIMKKEGIGAPVPSSPVKALSTINISGFVTGSYFYDTSVPADRKSN